VRQMRADAGRRLDFRKLGVLDSLASGMRKACGALTLAVMRSYCICTIGHNPAAEVCRRE